MLIPWGCGWKVRNPAGVNISRTSLFFTGFYDVLYASAAGFLPSTVSHAAMLGRLPKAVFF